jgi:ABC-type sugar transport system ATPase subunit
MTLLAVSNIDKQGENNFVLKSITFTQKKFQKIAIAGETGSGKSTLLKIIAGLIQPDSGEVYFGNEKVKGPADKLVPGHPSIAYLSQHFELAHSLRVEQVLSYANMLSYQEADTLFDVCRISHLLKRRTDQLSGGEKQRIAIARLLISWPALLLLDEPFSNLDRVHQTILENIIHDIGKRLKITCILVSHDPMDTLSWADRILVMKDGKIIQQGTPEKIYHKPVNEYTAALFGKYNLIKVTQADVLKTFGIKLGKKNVMIRPEHFRFVSKKNKAVRGKVTSVNFFGSYYEIEVSLLETTILVRAEQNNIKKGDTVYLSLSADGVWYV